MKARTHEAAPRLTEVQQYPCYGCCLFGSELGPARGPVYRHHRVLSRYVEVPVRPFAAACIRGGFMMRGNLIPPQAAPHMQQRRNRPAHSTRRGHRLLRGRGRECIDEASIMALAHCSSLMTLGLKGDRGMARHNSVPSLGSKVVEFNFGRPKYAVSYCCRAGTPTIPIVAGNYAVKWSWKFDPSATQRTHTAF